MFPRESLGTLAQPRGRPRSPESATQLTGYARDRCLGAGADTRLLSGQRDRVRVGDRVGVRIADNNNWESRSRRKTNSWQQQMIVCRHAREQGSGAGYGSCVSRLDQCCGVGFRANQSIITMMVEAGGRCGERGRVYYFIVSVLWYALFYCWTFGDLPSLL